MCVIPHQERKKENKSAYLSFRKLRNCLLKKKEIATKLWSMEMPAGAGGVF